MTSLAARLVLALVLGGPAVTWSQVRADKLDPRIEAAVQLYREDGAEKALPVFEQLAGQFTPDALPRDLAAALHYIGECHWRIGNFPEAHRHLDRALTLERSSGDRVAEARTRNVLGLLSWDEGNYDRAVSQFRQAGELARAAGDRKLEGASLNNLSLVFDEQGDYDTSLKQYRQVLELYRGANFPRGIGDTLGNIGGVYLLLGHFREALGYYQKALSISEQLKSKAAMSQDHGNIGHCLLGLGDVDGALLHLDRAIDLAKQAGMRQDEAYWLRVRGNGHMARGRYDLGLQDFRAALAIYETVGAHPELAETLHDYGRLHLLLGDTESAEHDFRRALGIARAIELDRGITLNLVTLGDVEFRRKRPDVAATLYEQARQRAATNHVQYALAMSLLRLARVDRLLQRFGPAVAETDQSFAIAREIGAPDLEAEALFSRAELARLQNRHGEALENYTAAERAGARTGDPDLLWQIQLGKSRAQEASGDVRAALASLEAAVELIEGVRNRLRESRFRSGYVEDKFEVYLELMRLQLQQGSTGDAFSTAERLRAQSFVEQLGGRVPVSLSAGDRRKEAELRERVRRLQGAIEATDDDGAPEYPERATQRFSQELLRAEKEYQTFLDDHARPAAAIASAPDASSVQRRLASDQALLEYVVGTENVVVFVLTPRGMAAKSLPIREPDLVARIALLRDLIRRPGDEHWRKPASRLSAELLEPLYLAGWLDGINHLYVVPHGVLTYVPFAMLPQPPSADGDLLIDRYTVAYLPAATALLHESAPPATARSMLVVAPSRGGLRHAPGEARVIGEMFRPNARTLIGAEATESRFKQLAGGFGALHLATHGYFNRSSPLLSGLELEADQLDDGMLRVHEIVDLPLRASLVTLSACDTALGSGFFAEVPAGDEFIGLNRAFIAAGSASVMATLWKVDDRASVSLMERFYGRLSRSGGDRDVAGALAFAQRAMRRAPQLAHPYYWAAYVVVGRTDSSLAVAKQSSGRKI